MIGNDGFLLNFSTMPQSLFYRGQLYEKEAPIHFELVTMKDIIWWETCASLQSLLHKDIIWNDTHTQATIF